MEALDERLLKSRPKIFNNDQGWPFTAVWFWGRLLSIDVAISMDSCGLALNNVFVERLWRSLEYDEVYLWGLLRRLENGGLSVALLRSSDSAVPGCQTPSAVYGGNLSSLCVGSTRRTIQRRVAAMGRGGTAPRSQSCATAGDKTIEGLAARARIPI